MTALPRLSGRSDTRLSVSVVLCTYNRAALLAGALDALVHQSAGTPPYEVVVVDNNSSDNTRAVVEQFAGTGCIRYVLETYRGLSAARNRGIAETRADLIAFTDDDVRVDPNWIASIEDVFAGAADLDMAGGKVEPVWEAPPPSWLGDAGVAPLALVDYGNEPFRIAADRAVCLLGANLCARRRVFDRIGLFSTVFQRVDDSIGSTEDHELEYRLLAAGGSLLYEPRLVVRAIVPRARLTKRYHRAWHAGHGRYYAMMHDPAFEGPQRRTWLGVPAHVYRRMVRELAAWMRDVLLFKRSAAFRRELRLRFLIGFTQQRIFLSEQGRTAVLRT